jgi:hypothetical protein
LRHRTRFGSQDNFVLLWPRLASTKQANMNDEQREEMRRLCILIQSEQDPNKLSELARRLDDLLEGQIQEKRGKDK